MRDGETGEKSGGFLKEVPAPRKLFLKLRAPQRRMQYVGMDTGARGSYTDLRGAGGNRSADHPGACPGQEEGEIHLRCELRSLRHGGLLPRWHASGGVNALPHRKSAHGYEPAGAGRRNRRLNASPFCSAQLLLRIFRKTS